MDKKRDLTVSADDRGVFRAIAARGSCCRAIVGARSVASLWHEVTVCLVDAGYTAAAFTLGCDNPETAAIAACAGLDATVAAKRFGASEAAAAESLDGGENPSVVRDLEGIDGEGSLARAVRDLGGEAVARFRFEEVGGRSALMSLFAPEGEAFDRDELAQLNELTIDIAVGCQGLGSPRAAAATPFGGLPNRGGLGRAPSTRVVRKTDQALREQLEMIRSITDSATDAILMIDDGRRISYWNRAAQEIFGWTADEAIGMEIGALLAPEQHNETVVSALECFFESGGGSAPGTSLEMAALRKNGVEFPIEISLSSVRLRGKWQATGILRDITDRKKHLEDLQNAMRAAQAAAEAKSMFLANVSHEIRTPLNGIIGMTDLLLDTPLSTQQNEFARIVKRSGEILLAVINDILDFSKMDAEALQFESIVFSVSSCVEDVGDLLGQKAASKGIELVVLTDHQVPRHVRGDPGRLRQVLMNLVNNAIKFTHSGEVAVKVRPVSIDDHRVEIEFDVEDTGIGIPDDRIVDLFQPFTQVDASTTRVFGGTGLGLSISSKLVERMGGKLEVESVEGKGSVFRFTARFEPAQLDETDTALRQGSLDNLEVLVVDDNATNRRLLEELLGRWGCRTVSAATGGEAIDLLFGGGVTRDLGLAILDFSMPGMDGVTLASTIKMSPAFSGLPLILLTSMPEMGDAERMQKAGFAAYLTKPVKASYLYDSVLSVLAGTAEPAAVETPRIITRHTVNEARRSRLRILVVDDNLINQKVVARMLERLGLRCDLAGNGQEAIDALENRTYDVVFMDCQMPVVDGFEATRRIRAREGDGRHTQIIAATAEALAGDRERCLESGMDGYISKPINFEELAAVLRPHVDLSAEVEARPENAEEMSGVDFSRIEEIGRGDDEFKRRIVSLFIGETENWRECLQQGLESEDYLALRSDAHALKGGAANIGAVEVATTAARLQQAAEDESAAACVDICQRLFSEMDAAVGQLREYLRRLGPGLLD